jgi:hypothetical protein
VAPCASVGEFAGAEAGTRAGRIPRLRPSEVEDFDLAFFNGNLDVLRLQVAMEDAFLVGSFERLSNLQRNGKAFIEE